MVQIVCLGLANLDHRFWLKEFPPTRRRMRAEDYVEDIGGPAAVAAVTVSRLGAQAVFIGRRGDDVAGQETERFLRQAGVDTSQFRAVPGATTPTSAVLIDETGERYIFHFPGRDLSDAAGWVDVQVLDHTHAVLIDGRWPQGAQKLAAAARARGLPVVLDLDRTSPDRWGLASVTTHVIADQDVAEDSGGTDTFIERIRMQGAWAAVTMSDQGVLYEGGRMPAYDVPVRDSTGAGDVFHGAFALALAEGRTETEALSFATAAAALRCMLADVPDREQVERLLSQGPPGVTKIR